MMFRLVGLSCVVLIWTTLAAAEADPERPVPDRAEDVRPLTEGDRAPTATLLRPDGDAVEMADLYREKPTMLIFYRGGWCPYCSVHLGQIAEAEGELVELGYQVLAISPDRPEALRESAEEGDFKYELLSDSRMELAKAFGVAFRVDDETVEQYRGFGIDLAAASGHDHQLLPVPAVYIIDTEGVIRFAHWDADYKERLEPEELITAARQGKSSRQ
jgi:peroxiredoxin